MPEEKRNYTVELSVEDLIKLFHGYNVIEVRKETLQHWNPDEVLANDPFVYRETMITMVSPFRSDGKFLTHGEIHNLRSYGSITGE